MSTALKFVFLNFISVWHLKLITSELLFTQKTTYFPSNLLSFWLFYKHKNTLAQHLIIFLVDKLFFFCFTMFFYRAPINQTPNSHQIRTLLSGINPLRRCTCLSLMNITKHVQLFNKNGEISLPHYMCMSYKLWINVNVKAKTAFSSIIIIIQCPRHCTTNGLCF